MAVFLTYICGMIFMVTLADQNNNCVQVCTKQTFQFQEVIYDFSDKQVKYLNKKIVFDSLNTYYTRGFKA
jgi:hypothetical protein